MALKKSNLYSSLWEMCDESRGRMDASQYKDDILNTLFMKIISDESKTRQEALLTVPEGGESFGDMVAIKGGNETGDKINEIIAKLAKAANL